MKGYLLEESEAREMGAPTPVPRILKWIYTQDIHSDSY
jgi:hypothetical protein